MVILCGSLISMMESQTLSYSSPLYGRRTAQIRMKQVPFRYYPMFFPGKTEQEYIEMYSVTGGVPKYIESFGAEKDIYTAIERHVLNRSSYLYDEPYYLLQQEVSEIGSYFSIIKTIAAGNCKLSAMSAALEVKATGLTKYLKTLIDLDILEREVPATEDNPDKSKKGLYKIKDNYLRFWFAFIYPNRSFIESGQTKIVMDKIQKGLVSNQIAFVYEDICREKMWEMNADENGRFIFRVSAVTGTIELKLISLRSIPTGIIWSWANANIIRIQSGLMCFMRSKTSRRMSYGEIITVRFGISFSVSMAIPLKLKNLRKIGMI